MGESGLSDLLMKDKLLSPDDCKMIARECGHTGAAFAKAIVAMGLFDESALAAYLFAHTHLPMIKTDIIHTEDEAVGIIDLPLLGELEVMPVRLEGENLLVAMADPLDKEIREKLKFFTPYRVKPVIARFSTIHNSLKSYLPDFQLAPSPLETFFKNYFHNKKSGSGKRKKKVLGAVPLAPILDTKSEKTPDDLSDLPLDLPQAEPEVVKAAPPVAPPSKEALSSMLADETDFASFEDDVSAPLEESEVPQEAIADVDDLVSILADDSLSQDIPSLEESPEEDLSVDISDESGSEALDNDLMEELKAESEELGPEGSILTRTVDDLDQFDTKRDEASVEPILEEALPDMEDSLIESHEDSHEQALMKAAQSVLATSSPISSDDAELDLLASAQEVDGVESLDELNLEASVESSDSSDMGDISLSEEEQELAIEHNEEPILDDPAVGFLNHAIAMTSLTFTKNDASKEAIHGLVHAGIECGVIYIKEEGGEINWLADWGEKGSFFPKKNLSQELKLILLEAPIDEWQKLTDIPEELAFLQSETFVPMVYKQKRDKKQLREILSLVSFQQENILQEAIKTLSAELIREFAKKM